MLLQARKQALIERKDQHLKSQAHHKFLTIDFQLFQSEPIYNKDEAEINRTDIPAHYESSLCNFTNTKSTLCKDTAPKYLHYKCTYKYKYHPVREQKRFYPNINTRITNRSLSDLHIGLHPFPCNVRTFLNHIRQCRYPPFTLEPTVEHRLRSIKYCHKSSCRYGNAESYGFTGGFQCRCCIVERCQ